MYGSGRDTSSTAGLNHEICLATAFSWEWNEPRYLVTYCSCLKTSGPVHHCLMSILVLMSQSLGSVCTNWMTSLYPKTWEFRVVFFTSCSVCNGFQKDKVHVSLAIQHNTCFLVLKNSTAAHWWIEPDQCSACALFSESKIQQWWCFYFLFSGFQLLLSINRYIYSLKLLNKEKRDHLACWRPHFKSLVFWWYWGTSVPKELAAFPGKAP